MEWKLFRGSARRRRGFALRREVLLPAAAGVFSFFVSDGPISFNSERNGGKNAGKNCVFAFPHALSCLRICLTVPHVHANLPVSFRQRTVSATAPLPLMPTTNNASTSTVAAHERRREAKRNKYPWGAAAQEGSQFVIRRDNSDVPRTRGTWYQNQEGIAWADFQTAGLNGVFAYFCRQGQKYLASEDAKHPHRKLSSRNRNQ